MAAGDDGCRGPSVRPARLRRRSPGTELSTRPAAGYDADREVHTGWAIRALKRFAKLHRVHIIVVAHPAKMQRKQDGKYTLPEPSYDIADSALLVQQTSARMVDLARRRRTRDLPTSIMVARAGITAEIGRPGQIRGIWNEADRAATRSPTTAASGRGCHEQGSRRHGRRRRPSSKRQVARRLRRGEGGILGRLAAKLLWQHLLCEGALRHGFGRAAERAATLRAAALTK